MPAPAPTAWPCLSYADARTAIAFLVEAFGFEELAVYGEGDVVHHAELIWPAGGGVMCGSVAGSSLSIPAGVGSVYLITDEPDALHARALAAGAVEALPLKDEDYGSRGFTARDPEGVYWSFGTYRGHDDDHSPTA